MNNLRESLTEYLAMRRALGYKLYKAGKGLSDFVSFLEQRGESYITTRLALEWAQQPTTVQPNGWAKRLGYVRVFAKYLSAIDLRTEVPSSELLPYKPKRARPYLYTQEEVQLLLTAALNLPPVNGLRGLTYYSLFGLLAVTGMRISEALNLKVEDVDLNEGILTIRGAKFGKTRLVPLHPSTRLALCDYKVARDLASKDRAAVHFFVNKRCNRLNESTVEETFRFLSRQIGIRGQDSRKGPRIHDFRHRLAVETLLQWYRSGADPQRRLPVLSTYLGHVHVRDTYWYLTACPELMEEAVKRLEERWEVRA